MKDHDATEIAYKNGYAKALKDFKQMLSTISTEQELNQEVINTMLESLEKKYCCQLN